MKRISFLLIALLLIAPGCRRGKSTPTRPSPRIVSHSAAITDLLYGMGLGEHVVGVTTFCMPPDNFNPRVVGDRTTVSSEAILATNPDVVLIQQDPKAFAAVTAIKPDLQLVHLTIETFADVTGAMDQIAEITGSTRTVSMHTQAFEAKLQMARNRAAGRDRPLVLFVGGFEHPFTGGVGTFIDEMITTAGGRNAAAERRYKGWPSLNRENIIAMKPDVLICQVPEDQAGRAVAYWNTLTDLPAVKNNRIYAVTDRRWTIPSMHSADFAARLSLMIHPTPKETK